ncbi:mitochondrial chaperone BCS1 [Ophiocordyceps camponoti-floridani]|uniref:Mitochondrial chaperone BCS1 n=1 Tax=Ophiocordyceps camponoti-floridani TaxID=2030778 RepID=A0A8H4QCE8_9HYPO|nr:mitochondrial chaperone BCS1 [Ophiocordyceps camponoti-floridani]
MAPASRSGRVRPAEVAAETKRNFIPLIRAHHSHEFPPYSVLYRQPVTQLAIQRRVPSTRPPVFRFVAGDPVMAAESYGASDSLTSEQQVRIPFICAANEKRPGGDWETGCSGYEEKLCRRSNLSATLGTPDPATGERSNYPIPTSGGILSDSVVVWRGPHDRYDQLDDWYNLPIVSVPPIRWPKLRDNGTRYSFSTERDMMRDKMRGALRICLYHGYDRVVIGDFGLGNSCRNPPRELAEIWRDVFLFDPDMRGQFVYVVFAFEDAEQSTVRLILDEIEKRNRNGAGPRPEPSTAPGPPPPTDMAIFQLVFADSEIERVLSAPDPRYDLNMITS